VGHRGCIHPYHYYEPYHHHHDGGDSDNKLRNVNNIKIDVVCPSCRRPKPHKSCRNKIVNINNITICVDGCRVRHDYDRW